MLDAQPAALSGWENFYLIVGPSAAALIGLQFVVIALVKDTRTRTTSGTISAFGTPTIVHLAWSLLVSCIVSAPWASLRAVAIALAITGLAGLAYASIVIARTRRQEVYSPVFEDWLWHAILPCTAYAAITLAALLLSTVTRASEFIIAASALALLLIAIHNAWDTVTYVVVGEDGGAPAARGD